MKRMMVVVAVAAIAGAAVAAGLGPQSYVQEGLVTHFDAYDNEGTGTHNPSATTWRDLKVRLRSIPFSVMVGLSTAFFIMLRAASRAAPETPCSNTAGVPLAVRSYSTTPDPSGSAFERNAAVIR